MTTHITMLMRKRIMKGVGTPRRTACRHALQRFETFGTAESLGLVIGDEARESAVKEKSTKRNDKRLDPDLRYQKSVDQTERGRDRDYHQNGQRPPEMPVHQKDRKQNAQQRKNGAHRQVYAAGYDHNTEADAEDAVNADKPGEILQVGRSKKAWIKDRQRDAKNDQQNECSEFLSHTFSVPDGKFHDRFFAGLGAVKNTGDRALVHHGDAVALARGSLPYRLRSSLSLHRSPRGSRIN
jgi:hypothetical protein